MGSASSKTTNQAFTSVSKSVTNVMTSQEQETTVVQENSNNVEVIVGKEGKVTGCDLEIGQSITSTSSIKAMSTFTNTKDLQDKLKAAVDNTVKNSDSVTQGAFSTALNVSNSKTNISQSITNIIEKNITDKTTNKLNSIIKNMNNAKLLIEGQWSCGPKGTIEINQAIVTQQLTDIVMEALTKNISTSEVAVTAAAKVENETKVTQQGAIDAVGDAGEKVLKAGGEAIGDVVGAAGLAMLGPLFLIFGVVVVGAVIMYVFRGTISNIAEKRLGVSPADVKAAFGFGKRRSVKGGRGGKKIPISKYIKKLSKM
jgi:hypothetical protein